MKELFFLLFIINLPIFSQGWDNTKWEKLKFFDGNQNLGAINRNISDIKCFMDGSCYAVGVYEGLFIEVFKLDNFKNAWNRIYNGFWDINGDPEKWPIVLHNPDKSYFLSDSTICIYYYNRPLINIFNFITKASDTIQYQPPYTFGDVIMNSNGYGMASTGNIVYTTKNSWKEYNYKDIEFPSVAFDVPVCILKDNRFAIADYFEGDCYFTVSTDGLQWERYKVGSLSPQRIYFYNSNVGFIAGKSIKGSGDTRNDIIYKTTDGGKSWYEVLNQYNNPSWGIYDVVIFKEKYGVATSYPGLIYTTTDQGETWINDSLEFIFSTLGLVYFSSENGTCYMMIANQGIYGYDENLLGITSVPIFNYKPIGVYPNPFKASFFVPNSDIKPGKYTLKIYDINANLIKQQEIDFNSELQIDATFPSGNYYLIIENNNEHYFQKIIKE